MDDEQRYIHSINENKFDIPWPSSKKQAVCFICFKTLCFGKIYDGISPCLFSSYTCSSHICDIFKSAIVPYTCIVYGTISCNLILFVIFPNLLSRSLHHRVVSVYGVSKVY